MGNINLSDFETQKRYAGIKLRAQRYANRHGLKIFSVSIKEKHCDEYFKGDVLIRFYVPETKKTVSLHIGNIYD